MRRVWGVGAGAGALLAVRYMRPQHEDGVLNLRTTRYRLLLLRYCSAYKVARECPVQNFKGYLFFSARKTWRYHRLPQ